MLVVVNCKSPHAAEEIAGRGPTNANGIAPHAAEEIAGRVSVNVNCKSHHAAEEIAGRASVTVNCKAPHAAEEITGRVSANANCKPPHADEEIAGRVRAIGNSIFDDDTKAGWFFDESRANVHQQWAADRKAARPQVPDQDFLAKNAATGGVSVSQERQRLVDFENELDQVFTQLPKYALAALTAGGDMHIFDVTPISQFFEGLQERAAEKRWSAVRMHGALLTIRQLFDFMKGRNDQMVVEGQVSGVVVTRFLQNFKVVSQQKARKRKVDAVEERQERENECPNIPVIPAQRESVQHQTMVFSGQRKKNALYWAQMHLLVHLGMADAFLHVGNAGEGVPGGARNPKSAQPFTPFHPEKLEQFSCVVDTPPEMTHIAAGLVFCILCYLPPNPTKQCSRPFFGVLFGLCGRGWFDTWWIRASQQVTGRFVFEDYRVNGNDVVEWLGCPMGYRRLLALMRLVLEEAGACTKWEAQGYTMHSARHTLPLIARLRGESAADRQEIGRWSMSAAQDPTMRPLQSVMKKHNVSAAVLPGRYAQSVPAQAVFNVMERQVAVMRQYKQECGAEGLPRHETWENFQGACQ